MVMPWSNRMIEQVEENWLAFGRYIWRAPAVELHQEADLAWYASDLPSPLVNGVYGAQLTSDVDGRIRAVLDLFRARNNPMVWWVSPSTRPQRLGQRLLAHGLYREAEEAGMFCDMTVLPGPEIHVAGLRIGEITDRDGLLIWLDTMARGFELEGLSRRSLLSVEAGLPTDDRTYRRFLAMLDGAPVGIGALYGAAGVAGLYNIATLPRARRRGIGSAMGAHLMRHARAAGYASAILTVSEMGRPIYERLGFTACGVYEQYIFDPVTVLPDD